MINQWDLFQNEFTILPLFSAKSVGFSATPFPPINLITFELKQNNNLFIQDFRLWEINNNFTNYSFEFKINGEFILGTEGLNITAIPNAFEAPIKIMATMVKGDIMTFDMRNFLPAAKFFFVWINVVQKNVWQEKKEKEK